MKYASVCSGVEAATLAWQPLGWKAQFFSEIAPFPAAVLSQRYPDVPNIGDMNKINGSEYNGRIDLLTGGTPCQSFSVAGLRKGIDDERGSLAFKFAQLAHQTQCRWVLWENVPGVLSSNHGHDFAGILSLLAGWNVQPPADGKWRKAGVITPAPGGFGLAWRVLDAQYVRVDGFGRAVPQRRRRIFVVGYRDCWQRAAKVLFDHACLQWDAQPRRSKRQNSAGGSDRSTANANPPESGAEWWNGKQVADTLTCSSSQQYMPDQGRLQAIKVRCCSPNDARGEAQFEICSTLRCSAGHAIALSGHVIGRSPQYGGNSMGWAREVQFTLTTCDRHGMAKVDTVRKLTPVECERLMGFPDNYTQIAWHGKTPQNCPDSHRYQACGNSQCVNVMRWLGKRIDFVDKVK